MTDDKIAEIRARHEVDAKIATVLNPELPPTWTLAGWRAHDDRATLLAEVERLRAALKIAAGYVNGCYHAWHLTRDRAEAWRDLTKIRAALNDERAGELEGKP